MRGRKTDTVGWSMVNSCTCLLRTYVRGHWVFGLSRLCFLAGLVMSVCAVQSSAQGWPNRTVKVVVPYGAGGVSDTIVRIYADRLSRLYGVPFIIENRGGAGGAIGTEYAARSPNDGYTIYCAGGAPLTILPQMQKLSFDPVRDLAPAGMITVNGMALTIHPNLPVKSLADFISYVKGRPGQINYAIGGVGTLSHLSPALLSARVGLEMVAVPYQSMPPTIAALLSGTVHMFFGNISDIIHPIREGKVRLLAVSTEKRIPEFPNIPTVGEAVPGFRVVGWNACFVPKGTPQSIIQDLSTKLAVVSRNSEVVDILAEIGIDTVAGPPEQVSQAIQEDIPTFRAALEAAGLRRQDGAK
jgi:tripartite-type tricarboxylate transporter receptor subunit TctC